MSLSLISDKLAFLHDRYIAAIENCCASMVVKCTFFATHIASLPLGASFNTIFAISIMSVIRRLIQPEVVAIEVYT